MSRYTFISYAYQDSHFVEKLARHLRRRGIEIWLDQRNSGPDLDWDKTIERAVRRCDCFILVLSPAAVNSWNIRQQFLWARQSHRPILPILHQACELPQPLRETSVIDFVEQRYAVALAQVLTTYFPDQAVDLEYWSKIKSMWRRFSWGWWYRLKPLLWPGWLGPALVLALFFGAFLFSRSINLSRQTLPPTPEKLSVIPLIEVAIPNTQKEVRLADGKVMVYVPGGEFLRGSLEDDPLADEDERPQHPVFVDGFWIDKTEVTNGEYQLCVDSGVCTPQRHQGQRFAGADQPVVGVDWFQSVTYCQWVGGSLPTEAQWEKAARGTDGRIYPWGNDFDGSRLNYCDVNCIQDWKDRRVSDGYAYTAPVGNFPAGASPYGALDMSGNVWEWTADWYDPDYYPRTEYYNPMGPAAGQQRVIRGGSWHYAGRNLRAPNRHKDVPTFRYDKIGFRCVVNESSSTS